MKKASVRPKAPVKPKVKESAVVKACLDWLLLHGCYAWRNNTGSWKPKTGGYVNYGLVGSADIIGCTPHGAFIAVECKAGDNDLSQHQIDFGGKIKARAGIYIVAYSVDDLENRKAEILA